MTAETRRLEIETLPPLRLTRIAPCRLRQTNPMPRLTRLLCVVTALALPALGITIADKVPRAGETEASQAAAPVIPSDGAAAPTGAVSSIRDAGARTIAALNPASVKGRS